MAAYPSIEALPAVSTQTASTNAGSLFIQETLSPEVSPTVLPPRVDNATRAQTNGLILGSVVLVLIIIGGTLSAIRQKPTH